MSEIFYKNEHIYLIHKNNNEIFVKWCTLCFKSIEINDNDLKNIKIRVDNLCYHQYQNHNINSIKISLYKNRNIRCIEQYSNNKLNGIRKCWYRNGGLESTEYYVDNKLKNNGSYFNENGCELKVKNLSEIFVC